MGAKNVFLENGTRIAVKGYAKGLLTSEGKRGPHAFASAKLLSERPNGYMGIGVKSDKYRRERLLTYAAWMSQNLNHSFFIVGDDEHRINESVLNVSYDEDEAKRCVHKKICEVNEVIAEIGAMDRMEVIRWSRLQSDDIFGMLRMASHESSQLREDAEKCMTGNMKAVLRSHRISVPAAKFARDLDTLVDYALSEIAGILHIIKHGLVRNQSVVAAPCPIKVGPMSEGFYDSIVFNIIDQDMSITDSVQCAARYLDSDRIRAFKRNLLVHPMFGTVRFEFPSEEPDSESSGSRGPVPVPPADTPTSNSADAAA